MMNSQLLAPSIFDTYNKIEKPSSSFSWELPPHTFKLNKQDIVYSGDLQEFEIDSSGIYSSRFYVATVNALIRFPDRITSFPEAILRLSMPRMELFKDNSVWKYGFSLTAHEITLKFAAPSKDEATKWYKKLKKHSEVSLLHISKSYTIVGMIRRSSYSKIQLGTNNETGSQFMIKSVSKAHLLENSLRMKSLVNEIRILKELLHPCLLTLHEMYESDQYVHLTFDILKGDELFGKIKKRSNYTEADAMRIMKSLLGVIQHLHNKQIVHRDIKPENIFLQDPGDELKITSLALATKLSGQLETLCCGSPGYVAPEVLNKEGYGLKADIFSCGIIMYTLLTGLSPFAAPTVEAVIERNRQCDINFPMDIWKLVSPQALDLVVKMTQRDQYQRLSAKECLEHKWFEGRGAETTLKIALENMQKYGEKVVLEQKATMEPVKPTGLVTSSPLLVTRKPMLGHVKIDKKSTDSILSAVLKKKFMKAASMRAEEGEEFPVTSKKATPEEAKNLKKSRESQKSEDSDEIPSEDSPEIRIIPDAPGSGSISKVMLEAMPGSIKKSNTTPDWKHLKKDKDCLEEPKTTSSVAITNPFLQDSKRSHFLEGADTDSTNARKLPMFITKGESKKAEAARKALQKLE